MPAVRGKTPGKTMKSFAGFQKGRNAVAGRFGLHAVQACTILGRISDSQLVREFFRISRSCCNLERIIYLDYFIFSRRNILSN